MVSSCCLAPLWPEISGCISIGNLYFDVIDYPGQSARPIYSKDGCVSINGELALYFLKS